MLCEKYKPALIEAAITGAELAPAIRAHAESCAHCAAELTQQRSLVAAIDANLHHQMNAPVPAATLQRLGAHLAQQPQPMRAPRFAQIFAGTLATLAVAATIILLFPRHRPQVSDANRIAPQPTQNDLAHSSVVADSSSKTAAPLSPQPKTPSHARSRIFQVSTAAAHHEPEVLVPPDERVALDQLIANLSARHELAAGLIKPLREKPEQPVKQIEIPDIKTAALFIAPIAEETRR
jgi:hypothetical protein